MPRSRFQYSVLLGLVSLCLILVTAVASYFVRQKFQRDPYAAVVDQWQVGNLTHSLRLLQDEGLGDSPRGKLLQSRCLRWLGKLQAAKDIVSEIDEVPQQLPALQSEKFLLRILANEEKGTAETLFRSCLKLGIHPLDALHSCTMLCVERRDRQAIDSLLSVGRDHISEAWFKYFKGLSSQLDNQNDQAIQYYREAIALEPSNELAHLAMVELFLSQRHADQDAQIDLLSKAVVQFPDNPEFFARYVRANRIAGKRFDIDQWLSTRTLSTPIEANEVAEYFAHIGLHQRAAQIYETNLGLTRSVLEENIDQSFELIQSSERSQSDREQGVKLLEQANRVAVSNALSGKPEEAHSLFSRGQDRAGRVRRIVDLKVKLAFSSDRNKLQTELNSIQDLNSSFAKIRTDADSMDRDSIWAKQLDTVPTAEGISLYQAHCAQCHGEFGDGMGRASATLYPYPRSFRHEPMRYVSAVNKLATDDDLKETLLRGLQGSGMPAHPTLSERELRELIKVTRYFQAIGLRDRYLSVKDVDDEKAMLDWIKNRFIPSDRVFFPESFSEFNIDEGRIAFVKFGCDRCHTTSDSAEIRRSQCSTLEGFRLSPGDLGKSRCERVMTTPSCIVV